MPMRSRALRNAESEAVGHRPVATIEHRGLLGFLESARQGFIFIDGARGSLCCSAPAERLLRSHDPRLSDAPSVRRLARALINISSESAREVLSQLRAARDGAAHFEIDLHDATLQIDVSPVDRGAWLVTLEDISARRAAESSAAALARIDPLTKLPNRLMLRERLEKVLAEPLRGCGCALLLVDLDRFKPINDTLGHPMGDALLEKVADRLRSVVQPSDTVARIGGDEFVILKPALSGISDAQALAQRIVDLVGRTYMIEGQLLSIGASVGIALAPGDGTSADTLFKNVDLALYRAKQDGRGTFRFFEPSMDARMQARRQLELDMRQALARKEFKLHYQPQLNLETNRFVGCEALIRWPHPRRGLVSPADFIPIAEEIGLIVPIGEWVIRQACRDAANWPLPLSIAVNVSPAQFKSDRLVELIMAALASSGLPASRLEIEITEGVLLQENEKTLQTLHRLRELGVRVSMDDFGTGYSSLSYLRSFPFDKIKIDRSFVSDLARAPDGDAIIRAISGLGKSLGMTTVAEGVETEEQMQRIRAEGCTDVQGYLISKPVPNEELAHLFDAHAGATRSHGVSS